MSRTTHTMIEALESRELFSTTLAGGVIAPMKKAPAPEPSAITCSLSRGGTLDVTGTGGDDQIVLTRSGNGRIYVSVPRKGGRLRAICSVRAKSVAVVSVRANSGNDFISLSGLYGKPCDAEGGAGNDRIEGSGEDDILDGGRGDDEIHAFDGNDLITGGSGNDILLGGDDDDVIDGGSGSDHLYGGLGNDTIDARDGKATDFMYGGPGTDSAHADKDPLYTEFDVFEKDVPEIQMQIEHITG